MAKTTRGRLRQMILGDGRESIDGWAEDNLPTEDEMIWGDYDD